MSIFDFFLSRNGPAVTSENYIGHVGRLFYDSATGEIRISDGVTAGGNPIAITVATANTVGGVRPGAGFTVSPSGVLGLNAGPSFYLDDEDVFRLRPGSADLIGGIKAGAGVVIDSEGTLTINLDDVEAFSFGDFTATVGEYTDTTEYALLSVVNENEDIVIASNGTGSVKAVGQFDIYKTNGTVTGSLEDAEPFFRVKDDGQVRMLVPAEDPLEGAVEIIGSASGSYVVPGQSGAMLQITGNPEIPARVYLDGNAEYASFVARRYNGTVLAPTAVLANQDVFRLNATAATTSGVGGVALAQIRITALENQTPAAQGSKIVFTVTPVGVAATSRVDVATISTADGVSATKFTTTGTVTARNYSGQARDAGTVAAGAGNEITIDFATDHIVRCDYSTEPIQVGFTNYSAGKTVTLIATNTSGINRQLDIGIAAANTQGVTPLDVNNGTTAIVTYYCTGATVNDVFASTVYDV
jgi:hypothetical protein